MRRIALAVLLLSAFLVLCAASYPQVMSELIRQVKEDHQNIYDLTATVVEQQRTIEDLRERVAALEQRGGK